MIANGGRKTVYTTKKLSFIRPHGFNQNQSRRCPGFGQTALQIMLSTQFQSQARGREKVMLTTSQSFDEHVRKVLTFTMQVEVLMKGSKFAGRIRKELRNRYTPLWNRIFHDEFHKEKSDESRSVAIFSMRGVQSFQPFRWAMSGTPFEISPVDMIGYDRAIEQAWEIDLVDKQLVIIALRGCISDML